jgi:glycosyltransferase involved in cell wall biosynthesis
MLNIIVTGQRHISIPNLPRYSPHKFIIPQPFYVDKQPIEKVWYPLGSFIPWQQVDNEYQLVHTFNKIIYTHKPWFATFEDHRFLYRNPKNQLEKFVFGFLNRRLALDNCYNLIAISDYARFRVVKRTENWDIAKKIQQKLLVIHPNFPVQTTQYKTYGEQQNLQLIFVGNHIARKGGIVALRLAKKAQELRLPITVHIVSNLWRGQGVPTDFPDRERYNEDLKLLDLDNVVFHGQIPNEKVLTLLAQSHFQIMASLMDTYGFSLIEGFSVATPAITTNICALPEIVRHGDNGYVLELPLDELRHWANWLTGEKTKTEAYWEIVNNAYDDLAARALQQIREFLDRTDKREHYELLSAGALAQAQNVNNAQTQNDLFDRLYSQATGLY